MGHAKSTDEAAGPRRHWTAAIYTRLNPLMGRVLTSRWHRLASGRTVLLGITGRRTGQQYEICVGYAPFEPHAIDVLVSDASNRTWWRNFNDGGPVRVVLRGEELDGWATAHRAPTPEFKTIADRALPAILGRAGAKRFFAVADLDPERGLSPEDLARLDGFAVAVSVTVHPSIEPGPGGLDSRERNRAMTQTQTNAEARDTVAAGEPDARGGDR
ncbi:hypothetical protein [Aquihabitans sp. McL0605]|uniref:hypothetical protein n=1 Tax=Aquihabitans sp. McL0605 TaxID=3415671 RepID=UPI003CF5125D